MKTIWLPGYVNYGDALKLQDDFVAKRQRGELAEDVLLLLQHASVYTIGRTKDKSSLNSGGHLPYPVYEINRGGQATYHGPGQLVGYPITDLNRVGRDLHQYVSGVEQTLIKTCSQFGVHAETREGLIGVWVEDRKLASIGVGVRKWITMHGFAINIGKNSLTPFLNITPCGLEGVKMTCLELEMERNGVEVPTGLLEQFGELFSSKWEDYCTQKIKQNNGTI